MANWWTTASKLPIILHDILAQSICIHYSISSLSGQPNIFFRVWNLRKSGPKYGPEKIMAQKKRVIVIPKEKRQPGLFSFGITMTLFFCTLLFSGPYFGPNFFRVTNWPMFSKQERQVQIDHLKCTVYQFSSNSKLLNLICRKTSL